MSSFTEIKDNLFSLLDSNKGKLIADKLLKLIKTKAIPLSETYTLIGELTKAEPIYFMNVIYPILFKFKSTILPDKIQRITKKHFRGQINELNDHIRERDVYILENYCFLKGEEIILDFPGSTYLHKSNIYGKIYLTNYRIINVGSVLKSGILVFGLLSALIVSGITSSRKAIQKAIIKEISDDISTFKIGEWGYTIPIINAYKIRKYKSEISYSINLKERKIKVSIVPLRKYKEKREAVTKIEQQLLKYQ